MKFTIHTPKFLLAFIYISINGLFVLKYLKRIPSINEWVVFFIYLLFWVIFFKNYYSITRYLNRKLLFYGAVLLFFSFTLLINSYVDGNTLNIDRWSAMEVGIEALLNNEYPYSAIDHLGGRTSNLPTLLFLGIPFYLIGDVGYLQSFTFLIYTLVISLSFNSYGDRLFGVLLAVLSPAYLYEIYCKSDLISNLIIVLFFVTIFQKSIENHKKINPYIFGFFTSALLLTRLVTVIILSLFGFKIFKNYNFYDKVKYIFTFVLTSIIFFFACFKNVSSIEHFYRHNPFALQSTQVPVWFSVTFVLGIILWSSRINKAYKDLVFISTLTLFFLISFAFIRTIYYHGMSNTLFDSFFDITYFNIITPFLLVSLLFHLRYKDI